MEKIEDWSQYQDLSMPKIEVKFKKLDPYSSQIHTNITIMCISRNYRSWV